MLYFLFPETRSLVLGSLRTTPSSYNIYLLGLVAEPPTEGQSASVQQWQYPCPRVTIPGQMIRALVMRGPHRFGRAVSYSTQGDNMSFLLLVNFWRYRGRGERNQSEPVSQFQRPQLRPLGPHCLWAAGEVPSVAAGGGCLLCGSQEAERKRGWTPPSPFERMPFDQLSPTRLQQVPPPSYSTSSWELSLQHLSLWEAFNRRGHTSPQSPHTSLCSL